MTLMTPQLIQHSFNKICFIADQRADMQRHLHELTAHYGQVPLEDADVVVVLGGDGRILYGLQQVLGIHKATPVFGINYGSIGFLMNKPTQQNLLERLNNTVLTTIYPLVMQAQTIDGQIFTASAVNEVSLIRQTHQAAKIKIIINQTTRLEELMADGILVATPAGSTAYNLSIYGPILPIDANLLALTPISAFRPRRWRGALLNRNTTITFEIHHPQQRPVSATADSREIRNITRVTVCEDITRPLNLLFDIDNGFNERVMEEQFL